MLCIKNGTIHDAVHREAYVADILVEDGKFAGSAKIWRRGKQSMPPA